MIMTPEQEKKLNEVHSAIVGNEDMGHLGIVTRLKDTEEYIAKDKRYKDKVAGGVFVGTAIFSGFWHWLTK